MKTTPPLSLCALALIVILMGSTITPSFPGKKTLGSFDDQTDIGKDTKQGSAVYDAAGDAYTITGSGTNMWMGQDEFHFVWKRMKGDFLVTTRARFIGK